MAINSPAAEQILKSAQQAGEPELLGKEKLLLTQLGQESGESSQGVWCTSCVRKERI